MRPRHYPWLALLVLLTMLVAASGPTGLPSEAAQATPRLQRSNDVAADIERQQHRSLQSARAVQRLAAFELPRLLRGLPRGFCSDLLLNLEAEREMQRVFGETIFREFRSRSHALPPR